MNGSRNFHVRFCVMFLWEQYLTTMNEIICIMKAVLRAISTEVDSWESTLGGKHDSFRQTHGFFIIVLRLRFHFAAIRMCGRGS